MEKQCGASLSIIPDDIKIPGKSGVFVCTHEQLIILPEVTLKEATVLIDEFHMYIKGKAKLSNNKIHSPISQLLKARQLIGVSATLGGKQSKVFLKE